MRKFVVLVAVLGLSAFFYWFQTSKEKAPAGPETTRAPADAKGTPPLAPTDLSPESAAKPNSKPEASREASAPDRLTGPPEIVAKYGYMDKAGLQNALGKVHETMRQERVRLRQESTAAEHKQSVSAKILAEPDQVARTNTPAGQFGDAVLARRDKEAGVDVFDFYLYSRDEVPEWAGMQDEADWIEARLKSLH